MQRIFLGCADVYAAHVHKYSCAGTIFVSLLQFKQAMLSAAVSPSFNSVFVAVVLCCAAVMIPLTGRARLALGARICMMYKLREPQQTPASSLH